MTESPIYFVSRNRQKFEEYRELLGRSDLQWSQLEVKEFQSMNLELLVEEKIEEIKRTLPDARFLSSTPGSSSTRGRGCRAASPGSSWTRREHRPLQDARDVPRTGATGHRARGDRLSPSGSRDAHVLRGGERVDRAAPRGPAHFGWDPIFIPEGDSRTYAEMSLEEKDRTSMRRDAAAKFRTYLASEAARAPRPPLYILCARGGRPRAEVQAALQGWSVAG